MSESGVTESLDGSECPMESDQSPSPGSSSDIATTRKKVSDVWTWFTKLKEEKKAQCRLCDKKLAYHGGTTNLRDHLLYVHPLKYSTKQQPVRQAVMDNFLKKKACSSVRSKEITDKVVKMIITDMRPIRMVECSGFKDLMHTMEPGYIVPTRKSVKTMIGRLHNECKEKLSKQLQSTSNISLTTDIWTSHSNDAYISLSVHFLTLTWELKCFILGTVEFPGSHTGILISEKIKCMCEEFSILSKVNAITHDEAANMQLSSRILEEEHNCESISCTAHRLQLCLKAGLAVNVIERLIKCSAKLVGHFKHRALACHELKKRQQLMGIKERKLIQHCVTRWNSTYYMLERLLEMRWPVTAVLSDDSVTKRSDRYLDLTTEQWTLAEELIKILQPFDVATTLLCAEKTATISYTLPILYGLLQHLAPAQEDNATIAAFKTTVKKEIEERWGLNNLDASSCLLLSSILDLRFKPLKFLTIGLLEAVKTELCNRMENIPESLIESVSGIEQCPPEKRCKSAFDILLGDEEDSSTGLENDTILGEVTKYLEEKPIPRSDCILHWWRINSSTYPRLAIIARGLLGIPSTSATSERIFSIAGLTVTKLRSALKPSNVDALIFLNKNYELL